MLRSRRLPSMALVAALAWAGACSAQARPSATRVPSFDQLDRNGDGHLTPREVEGTPLAGEFHAMDRNGDGRISRREYLAARGLQGSGPSTFDLLDANGDGFIDADEASRNPALARQFQQSDSDHNGLIDRSEFSAFEAARSASRP